MRFSSVVFLTSLIVLLSTYKANAAMVELSAMGAFSRADYSDGYTARQQRLSGSIEFKFTPVSGIQFEYTDSRTSTSYYTTLGALVPVPVRQYVSSRDKIYSFNLVQNLVPSKWLVQPYIKLGGGRVDRHLTSEIPEISAKATVSQRADTGVGGVGIRIFLLKNLALKGEFNTYVPDFKFSQWKENQIFTTGISWLF